jgi:hypothetical protein
MTSLLAVTLDSDSLNRQAMKHPHHHRSLVRCTRLTLDLHFSSAVRGLSIYCPKLLALPSLLLP